MSQQIDTHHQLEELDYTEQELKPPHRYKVLLHNDDYSSMEFVVLVLEQIFNHQPESAYRIMMQVHRSGIGVAGVYPRDIAETKVAMVHSLARKHEYPLKCSIERE